MLVVQHERYTHRNLISGVASSSLRVSSRTPMIKELTAGPEAVTL